MVEESYSGGMLAKGLILLVVLGKYPDGITLSDLARQVSMPISTVHRLLATLNAFGFVHFDAEYRRYSLGLRLFELSHQITLVSRLSEVAVPVMQRIVEITRETSLISVLDGEEMIYVERLNSPQLVQVRGASGGRGPLHCTAMGKSLLAFQPDEKREEIIQQLRLEPMTPHTITDYDKLRRELAQTRERGYSIANEEHEHGVLSVGVPVLNAHDWPLAALCVTAPAFRTSLEELIKSVPILQKGAREIALQLPRRGHQSQA